MDNLYSNAAYSDEYLAKLAKWDFVFTEEHHDSKRDRIIDICPEKYQIRIESFRLESDELGYSTRHSIAYVYRLHDENEELISSIKCYYSVTLFQYIEHSNGFEYLIFRRDLYGYSILNLNSLKVFHYIPKVAILPDKESFIWTEVSYSGNSNFLAVEGCYWACPYEIMIFDISNPEKLPYPLIAKLNDDDEFAICGWKDGHTLRYQISDEDDKVINREYEIER
jgi:hypothetical protein